MTLKKKKSLISTDSISEQNKIPFCHSSCKEGVQTLQEEGIITGKMRLVTEKPKDRYQPVPIVFQQSDQSLFQFL